MGAWSDSQSPLWLRQSLPLPGPPGKVTSGSQRWPWFFSYRVPALQKAETGWWWLPLPSFRSPSQALLASSRLVWENALGWAQAGKQGRAPHALQRCHFGLAPGSEWLTWPSSCKPLCYSPQRGGKAYFHICVQTRRRECQKELAGIALLIYASTVMTLRHRRIIY